MTLYDRIKKIADDNNMSISYIEENVQISNGSIAKWKNNTPKADNLYKVADFLGCSVEFLITGRNHANNDELKNSIISKESTTDYKAFLTENEIEVLNILRKFTDYRNQIKFIVRIEDLADKMLADIEDKK